MAKRVLLAGFGFMGQVHAYNILQNPDLELCGIVDAANPGDLLNSRSGNLNVERVTWNMIRDIPYFDRLSDGLMQVKPDAVVIATPTRFHYEMCLDALNAGCHVFTEKPVCLEVEKCRNLTAVAKERKQVLMVGHCVRFSPYFLVLKEAFDSGKYGGLQYLHMTRYTGVPGWGCWTDPATASKSGGALYDLVIHDIDCARALAGMPDEICTAPYIAEKYGRMLVDTIWRYKSGLIVHIEGGFIQPSSVPFHCDYTAVFEKATIYTDHASMRLCTQEGEKPIKWEDNTPMHTAEMNAFARYIAEGEMPYECSGEDALETLKLMARL